MTMLMTFSYHIVLDGDCYIGTPRLTQYGLGRGLPPYQVASWSI